MDICVLWPNQWPIVMRLGGMLCRAVVQCSLLCSGPCMEAGLSTNGLISHRYSIFKRNLITIVEFVGSGTLWLGVFIGCW